MADFDLGVHPVTRHEYADAVSERLRPVDGRVAADGGLPATDVSWWAAVAHCNRLSAREDLPRAYEIAPRPSGTSTLDGTTPRGDAEPDVLWDRGSEGYGTYRVLRGGGWFDEHWSCRASVRRRSHPTLRLDDVGFRIARGAHRG